MASVISKYLSVYAAKEFRESISQSGGANVFITIGRVSPWANDAEPVQADTSVATIADAWHNMIGGKRITGNDVYHVIPRFDWTSGTLYNAYDDIIDSKDLKNENNPFYVVTDQWNVYKCISNNYGTLSTYKPTQLLTTSHFTTPDGYSWKYMYTISASEQNRFTTTDYIPVKTLALDDTSTQWIVQQNATQGAIHSILVTEPGVEYENDNITVSIAGDGLNANAFAVRNTTSNTIESIVVDGIGSDYSFANITFTSANGYGAGARAIISPPGGHGHDPLTELGGATLILNPRIKGDESQVLMVQNDYRQITLLQEPYTYSTTTTTSNSAFNQLTKITLNGTSVEYQLDEYVYQGASLGSATYSGIVSAWDSPNNTIYLSNVRGNPSGDQLIGYTSTASRFLDSLTSPDLEPYSGKILYIDNIVPVYRSTDQTESFQIILKF